MGGGGGQTQHPLHTVALPQQGPGPAIHWSPHFLKLCNTNTAGPVGKKHNPSTDQMPPVTRAPDIALTY